MADTTPAGNRQNSKSETVYRELRERIVTGRYVAGYRLVLDHLAREFTVSAVPVREAIRRLEAEGLVRFTRNVGAEVSGIDTADYADTMQVLAYLEGAATALASPIIDRAHLDEAESINEQMRRLQDNEVDPIQFTALNERFHRLLCAACPNQHLLELLDREWYRMSLIRRTSFGLIKSRPAISVKEHQDILHLIKSDAQSAEIEAATRSHTLRTMYEYLETVQHGKPAK